jgi:endonuclease I
MRRLSDLLVLFVVDSRKQEWDFSTESRKAMRRDETFERVDTIAHRLQDSLLP